MKNQENTFIIPEFKTSATGQVFEDVTPVSTYVTLIAWAIRDNNTDEISKLFNQYAEKFGEITPELMTEIVATERSL
jgi:hypothetical protein